VQFYPEAWQVPLADPGLALPARIGRIFRELSEMGLHRFHLDVIIGAMLHKKSKKEPDNATHASVKKEMAKPRMARSARIAELNLDTARTPEQPSAVMPGTVDKIIPSPRPSQSEKAAIGC
jgi:hypothetical protein